MISAVETVVGRVINAGIAVAFTEAIWLGVANDLEKNSDDKSLDILEVLKNIGLNFKTK